MKKFFLLALIFAHVFTSGEQALANTSELTWQIAEIIELILERYVGEPVTAQELTEAALAGMTSILDDFSVFMTTREFSDYTDSLNNRYVGIGVTILGVEEKIIFREVFAGGPGYIAGLLPGDILISVDDVEVIGASVSEVVDMIRGEEGLVKIEVERLEEILAFEIIRGSIERDSVSLVNLENNPEISLEARSDSRILDYAYIRVVSVGDETANEFRAALEQISDARGLILDLRGNSGGYLNTTVELANMLVPAGPILTAYTNFGQSYAPVSTLENAPFYGKIIVLTDQSTASAAEVIASALQDSGAAIVVGQTTYGKGLIQSTFISELGVLKLTTEEFFRRNGETLNGVGVIPDIYVDNMLEYVDGNWRDLALEIAVYTLFDM